MQRLVPTKASKVFLKVCRHTSGGQRITVTGLRHEALTHVVRTDMTQEHTGEVTDKENA